MEILHFSLTPLAGSPIRICKALNTLADKGVQSRLVLYDSKGYINRNHPVDLEWGKDNDEVLSLVETADVIHIHNYIDLDCDKFDGVNFRALWNSGKPIVRQFHSTPDLVARTSSKVVEDIYSCPIPKLSIAQYPERFYPSARLIPNIVFDVDDMAKIERAPDTLTIGYSPSNFRSSRESRWDTKGYLETVKVLRDTVNICRSKGISVKLDIIEQVTHAECMRRKSACDISIDDVVTGSYHLSTLESLKLGSVAISYMDARVVDSVREVSGRNDFPALNVRLEELQSVLLDLMSRPDLVREMGRKSKIWMDNYWAPEVMALKFFEIYEEVVKAPNRPFRSRFDISSPDGRYRNIEFYDDLWKARHEFWPEKSFYERAFKPRLYGIAKKIGLR